MHFMHLFALEHGKLAYRADFAFYAIASFSLGVFLIVAGPREQRLGMVVFSFLGLIGWTLVEYLLHRFVLHGLRPFSAWHARHHARPTALISTPTILSASLMAGLVFLPALMLGGPWRGCALTFGMVTGYLAYSITHHASHHWRARHAWLKQLKYWHALHHNPNMPPCHYGVTCKFWDDVFGSSHPGRDR